MWLLDILIGQAATLPGNQATTLETLTDVPNLSGAANLESRIDNTLNRVRTIIPSAVASVEGDIATSNRDKVILALANFLGSMLFFSLFFL